ncbi:reverse transcriptase domain-containing protein [Tanacetum coccineum]
MRKKLKFVEQPIGPAPDPKTADRDTIGKYYESINLEQEFTCLMLSSMSPYLQRTLEKYNAFDMMKELKTMFEEQAKQELFETVKAFHACKQEDSQSISSYLLNMKSYLDILKRLGYAMPNEHGCLRGSRKLTDGALSQYMGNRMRAGIEAIGCFDLVLPNRGGEYLSHEFVNHMKSCGIVSQLTPPYTSQYNGVSERRNRTLLDMVRSMMNLTTLPKSFWGYALESAARILNMVPTKKDERAPYEIWHGKAPNVVEGCLRRTAHYYGCYGRMLGTQNICGPRGISRGFTGDVVKPFGKIELEVVFGDGAYLGGWLEKKQMVEKESHQNTPLTEAEPRENHSAKKKDFGSRQGSAVFKEVEEWLRAGIVWPVKYPTWISNPVLVKKVDGGWRICINFKNINSACPKDYYPLTDINGKIESVVGLRYKCFLDAYKGYHQVQMAQGDKEKIAFYIDQGMYCYIKMPFGLQNARATYQRLVDTTFQSQIGRNLEAYVDDIVIKSNDEKVLIADIAEMFDNL